jgi:hypothetical protein
MVRSYFETLRKPRGTLMFEYRGVKRSADNTGRWIDGVILLDGSDGVSETGVPFPSVRKQEVVVIQAKAARLGMGLLGQALFSTMLMEREEVGAKVVESIALCSKSDAVLEALCKQADERLRVVALAEAPLAEPSEE